MYVRTRQILHQGGTGQRAVNKQSLKASHATHPLGLGDVRQARLHGPAAEGAEAELGAARGERLDDARHVVADEAEAGDLWSGVVCGYV